MTDITAIKARLKAYIAEYRKFPTWNDRLNAVHDHDNDVVHEIKVSDLTALLEEVKQLKADAAIARLEGRREGIEAAATLADNGIMLDLPSPKDGPFTQQDKTIMQYSAAIRAIDLTTIAPIPDQTKSEEL